MIELRADQMVFTFPEVHAEAALHLDFQRTLRIPDDGKSYPLPPGLGRFPLTHVDDHAAAVPASWVERGGVMMPMFQAEAMWISFQSPSVDDRASYPFLVKIATGKINAVTGEEWRDGANRDPQDYLVVPTQPWLDGYCVEKGKIRQFVAMPLGAGFSAEEQLTGKGEWGGVQVEVYPMKRDVFERRFPKRPPSDRRERLSEMMFGALSAPCAMDAEEDECAASMGLAPGGSMEQEIYDDPFDLADWDLRQRSRCFVHLTNSMVWRAITGSEPPTTPPTAAEYESAGLPWFDWYSEAKAVAGSEKLAGLKSVKEMGKEKGTPALPENQSVTPKNVVTLKGTMVKGQVREW